MIFLFFALSAFAAGNIDYSLCNLAKNRGGHEPFFTLNAKGDLEFTKNHLRTLLISQRVNELSFFEYAPRGEMDAPLSFGGGEESVARTKVTLKRANGKPESLKIARVWKRASQLAKGGKSIPWNALKKELPKQKTFAGRETEDWATFGYSGNRCYSKQEGSVWEGRRLVSFDFGLCEQILRVTDRKATDLRKSWLGEDGDGKTEAKRVLQLIRGVIVKVYERLKAKDLHLMAAGVITPEHELPGSMPAEEASALRELSQCEVRLDADQLPNVQRGHETMDELN